MKYSKENIIKTWFSRGLITNKSYTLHKKDEIDFIIGSLSTITSIKDLYYYLERIAFNSCGYAFWDYNVENNLDWYKLARVSTKNSLEISHIYNNIDLYYDYIVDTDIDKILLTASKTSRSILVVVTPGATFENNKLSLTSIWPYFERNKNLLMAAHLIDNSARKNDGKNYYWSIHPQYFAINLNLYKEIGCPSFNRVIDAQVEKGLRSEENQHDNYTPIYLKSANEVQDSSNYVFSFGSNLINHGLKHNCDFENLTSIIRQNKGYCYQSSPSYKEDLELVNDNVIQSFYGGWDYVYLFNTEQYPRNFDDPIVITIDTEGKLEKLYFNSIREFLESYKVDSFVSVSSGFVGDWWNYLLKFDHDKIGYYDVNSSGLFYKKMLIEKWPGPKDIKLGDFLVSYCKVYESDVFFNMTNSPRPKNIEKWKEELNEYFDNLLSFWGEDEFTKYLERVKLARKFYFVLDLVNDPRAADKLSFLRKENYQLIFGSNIFDNRMLFYQNNFDKDKIFNSVNNFFQSLPSKTIYVGSNITGLKNSFYDKNTRVTQIYVKE